MLLVVGEGVVAVAIVAVVLLVAVVAALLLLILLLLLLLVVVVLGVLLLLLLVLRLQLQVEVQLRGPRLVVRVGVVRVRVVAVAILAALVAARVVGVARRVLLPAAMALFLPRDRFPLAVGVALDLLVLPPGIRHWRGLGCWREGEKGGGWGFWQRVNCFGTTMQWGWGFYGDGI